MNCEVDYCKADIDKTPQRFDTTGVTLYMQGHCLPSPMIHRLHNASPQECVGDTEKFKHVTWGGIEVWEICTYDMDNQRVKKI